MSLPLAIITGRIDAAIADLRPRFTGKFNHQTMEGEANGKPFIIISVEGPFQLRGRQILGYEIHPSAYGYNGLDECVSLARSRVRAEQERGEA